MRPPTRPPEPPNLHEPSRENGGVLRLVGQQESQNGVREKIVESLTHYVRGRIEKVLKTIPNVSKRAFIKKGTLSIEFKMEKETEDCIREISSRSLTMNISNLIQAGRETFARLGGNLVSEGSESMNEIEFIELGVEGMIQLLFPEKNMEDAVNQTTMEFNMADGKSEEDSKTYYEESINVSEIEEVAAHTKKKNGKK